MPPAMITQTSCLDAGQDCRMFCRPIRTGGGEVAVRPISPADAELVRLLARSTAELRSDYAQIWSCLRQAAAGFYPLVFSASGQSSGWMARPRPFRPNSWLYS